MCLLPVILTSIEFGSSHFSLGNSVARFSLMRQPIRMASHHYEIEIHRALPLFWIIIVIFFFFFSLTFGVSIEWGKTKNRKLTAQWFDNRFGSHIEQMMLSFSHKVKKFLVTSIKLTFFGCEPRIEMAWKMLNFNCDYRTAIDNSYLVCFCDFDWLRIRWEINWSIVFGIIEIDLNFSTVAISTQNEIHFQSIELLYLSMDVKVLTSSRFSSVLLLRTSFSFRLFPVLDHQKIQQNS